MSSVTPMNRAILMRLLLRRRQREILSSIGLLPLDEVSDAVRCVDCYIATDSGKFIFPMRYRVQVICFARLKNNGH
ncbi:MAG: hypothetical protein GPOALKHO_001071 [Sodalis sp.]|nr:MAG: hypothetical protein GPOALKHO_001071 [Sodalis sp.]